MATSVAQERLKTLAHSARAEIPQADTPERVEALRIRYLGKKGEISAVLANLGKLSPDERRQLGETANSVKAEVEQLLGWAVERAAQRKLDAELRGTKVDVTLPGRFRKPGHRHPVSRTLE